MRVAGILHMYLYLYPQFILMYVFHFLTNDKIWRLHIPRQSIMHQIPQKQITTSIFNDTRYSQKMILVFVYMSYINVYINKQLGRLSIS